MLNILCLNENFGGNWYTYKALANAFKAVGHNFIWWHGDANTRTPALDMQAKHPNIDIFMGITYGLDDSIQKAIDRWRIVNPALKVVLYGSACGKFIDELPPEYPIVKRGEDERRRVAKCKPDLIWIHHSERWATKTLEGWKKDGHPTAGIMNSADIIEYGNKPIIDYLKCDVGYTGGYWSFKAKTGLDKFIIPLCHPSRKLKVKIFGNTGWPVAQWMGTIQEDKVGSLFRSALVCPSVSEPHSRTHGYDPIERPFKVIAAGGFCVSDKVETLDKDVFQGELPMSNDPTEYIDMVEFYVKNPEKRIPIMEKCLAKVMGGHTSFHRINQLFRKVNLSNYCFDFKVKG